MYLIIAMYSDINIPKHHKTLFKTKSATHNCLFMNDSYTN